MHRLAGIAAALLLASPTHAAPSKPTVRLLVFNFTVHGEVAPELPRTLAEVAAREVSRVGGYQVLAWTDIAAQLSIEHQKQMAGCSEDRSCLAEIAGAIDAERTISGTVTRTAEGFVVGASLVDARRAATIGGAEESVRASAPEELFDAVRRVVFKMLTGRNRETGGVIAFSVAERAAQVVLDGKELGRGPLRKDVRVGEGLHRVTVAKEGYATWENAFRIEAGARAEVAPQLVLLPTTETVKGRAMGWSAVGTGAVALVAGGIAIWKESDARGRYSEARRMLTPAGTLAVGADATGYRDAVSAGDASHRTALVTGAGAGVALATGAVLGWLAYRQTGEIGPFRF